MRWGREGIKAEEGGEGKRRGIRVIVSLLPTTPTWWWWSSYPTALKQNSIIYPYARIRITYLCWISSGWMCPLKHSVEAKLRTSTTISSKVLVVKDDEEEVGVSMLRLFARYYTINAIAGPVSASKPEWSISVKSWWISKDGSVINVRMDLWYRGASKGRVRK